MQERETRLLMLVDDEPAQCRLVSAIASRAGWRTVFARDAETAIAMLGTQDGMMLDAIILDQWVPGADSASLISELKSRRPALPILLMTSIGSNEAAIDAMRAGASDYIIKPVALRRNHRFRASISHRAGHCGKGGTQPCAYLYRRRAWGGQRGRGRRHPIRKPAREASLSQSQLRRDIIKPCRFPIVRA
jgi:DNA-binding response OmpR family regulator